MTEKTLFSTCRLNCRRWLHSDIDAIYAVYSDEEGSRWVGDGLPIEYSECERWIEVTMSNYARRGYGMFALEEKLTQRVIGFCGLVHPGNQTEPEIKYALMRNDWGKGYASEIVPAMLSYGVTEHHLRYVIATVASENLASQRVLIKSGMRFARIETEGDEETLVYEWKFTDA